MPPPLYSCPIECRGIGAGPGCDTTRQGGVKEDVCRASPRTTECSQGLSSPERRLSDDHSWHWLPTDPALRVGSLRHHQWFAVGDVLHRYERVLPGLEGVFL